MLDNVYVPKAENSFEPHATQTTYPLDQCPNGSTSSPGEKDVVLNVLKYILEIQIVYL